MFIALATRMFYFECSVGTVTKNMVFKCAIFLNAAEWQGKYCNNIVIIVFLNDFQNFL